MPATWSRIVYCIARAIRLNKILKGFQSSTYPVPREDFERVLALLGMDGTTLREQIGDGVSARDLSVVDQIWFDATPVAKARMVKMIERGPAGRAVKRLNGYRCQVCEALGRPSLGYISTTGEPYVEAHHAVPLARCEKGSLHKSFIVTVCASHHRQLHFGVGVAVDVTEREFVIDIEGQTLRLPRLLDGLSAEAATSTPQPEVPA